jgi:hypothetical protein
MESRSQQIDRDRVSFITELLNNRACKKGVEIGVFKGQFSRQLLENWDGTLYMVDPWRPLGDEYIDASNHKNHMDAYQETMDNIRGFEDRAFMFRGLGELVVDVFEDNSLDFVYIDGNHAYDWVKQDIQLWWPKLKKNGLLMGHDYILMDWYNDSNFLDNGKDKELWMKGPESSDEYVYAGIFGVNPAVDEWAEEMNKTFLLTNEWTSSFIMVK